MQNLRAMMQFQRGVSIINHINSSLYPTLKVISKLFRDSLLNLCPIIYIFIHKKTQNHK